MPLRADPMMNKGGSTLSAVTRFLNRASSISRNRELFRLIMVTIKMRGMLVGLTLKPLSHNSLDQSPKVSPLRNVGLMYLRKLKLGTWCTPNVPQRY